MGYLQAGLAYSAVIAVIAVAYYGFRLNGILAFWLAYILTRPMGASFGDYFAQPRTEGGLGLGTTITSVAFLGCIAAIVIYMSLTREGLERASGSGS